jgi:hypothetical protein
MIYQFKKYSWNQDILKVIKQFVPDDVLFLIREDFNLTHNEWKDRLIEIEAILKQHNIEKILINATMNPEIVNKIYNADYPSPQQFLTDLNKICKTYYITSDYTYHYTPNTQIKFFPAFLWTISTRQVDEYFLNSVGRQYNTVYDTEITKTKSIMSLNRNLTWHRMYLFSLLAEQPWFDKITYSFLNKIENRLDVICVKEFLNAQESEKIQSLDHLLPIKIKSESNVQIDRIPIMWMDGASSVGAPEYKDHAINLVTETSLTEGIVLTEKTCKPFMAYQIPIIVGPVGANKFLQDMDLDMFGDYVPWHTWDSETDHKLKMQKIVVFLDQLMSKDTAEQDILTAHKNFHSRLIYNKERFHSKEFQNLLTHQISTLS